MLPFYKRMWFIVLLLIVFAPVGVVLLWLFGNQKKNTKIVLSVIFGIFFIILMASRGNNKDDSSTLSDKASSPKATINISLEASPSSSMETIAPTVEPTIEPTIEPTPSPTPIPKTYTLTVVVSKGKLKSNDHVGNSWSTSATINDAKIAFGKAKALTLSEDGTFTIVCSATENDKRVDEGYDFFEVNVSDLKTGKNVFVREVIVEENGGRYSGNIAVWNFTVTITKTLKK